MGGWIARGDDEIVPAPSDAAVRRNHDGAHRRFAGLSGQLGLGQREFHVGVRIHEPNLCRAFPRLFNRHILLGVAFQASRY